MYIYISLYIPIFLAVVHLVTTFRLFGSKATLKTHSSVSDTKYLRLFPERKLSLLYSLVAYIVIQYMHI